jgi:hypothetical protein
VSILGAEFFEDSQTGQTITQYFPAVDLFEGETLLPSFAWFAEDSEPNSSREAPKR